MDIDMNAMKAEIGECLRSSMARDRNWNGMGPYHDRLDGTQFRWHSPGLMCFRDNMDAHNDKNDLGDTEGNWMPNGMRLLAQVVGAGLAANTVVEMGL